MYEKDMIDAESAFLAALRAIDACHQAQDRAAKARIAEYPSSDLDARRGLWFMNRFSVGNAYTPRLTRSGYKSIKVRRV
jgi:hypothetical protein